MHILFEDFFSIEIEESELTFKVNSLAAHSSFVIELPCLQINNQKTKVSLRNLETAGMSEVFSNGVKQCAVEGTIQGFSDAKLRITFRSAKTSPIIRFKYEVFTDNHLRLTKMNGTDDLCYLKIKGETTSSYKEIRLSDFNELTHTFCLSEQEISSRHFENSVSCIGPIMLEVENNRTLLLAYEHGSQVPDSFLKFQLDPDFGISLWAVKGNYYNGQIIDRDHPFESIWFEFGVCPGNEKDIARYYRDFVLHYLSLHNESRKPYIFYNTWAYQERNKWWNKGTYLEPMNEDRILEEIEIAHQLGIDVFVLDTGWFEKTGDWKVNAKRFSDGLKTVKTKLNQYDMKLGLWFDPQAAAVTSDMLDRNKNCVKKGSDGREANPRPIWETEDSYRMCLVSDYYQDFANELIRLAKEIGVTYFKWDAIFQYGCYAAGHLHGMQTNTAQERADCYNFEIGRYMIKTVDRLCSECPDAIVDFDITEGHRFVGLGFLASGKYFLINNGPYYQNLNIPRLKTEWSNVFVYPGPARPYICRTPLDLDKWIPSVLFLTHYLPDDPASSQVVNVASLILGSNGIWGDLLSISAEGIQTIRNLISRYKLVREDITESYPIKTGQTGCSPEIYEKINDYTHKGAVVVFANNGGKYTYVTVNQADRNHWNNNGVDVQFDHAGRAIITCEFDEPGAKIIFFGS